MKGFAGKFPVNILDFVNFNLGKSINIKLPDYPNPMKTGETYEGECTKVEENNLLESKK